MGRNVEIKARLADPTATEMLAVAIADDGPTVIEQEDTFFESARGRLKLRQLGEAEGELIAYSRPDKRGPKTSQYSIARTTEPVLLRDTLSQALGVLGVVRKVRHLYLVGQTRIHLDRVEGLGDFLELEVVLRENQVTAQGEEIARTLMKRLGVRETALIEGAYIDLLSAGVG